MNVITQFRRLLFAQVILGIAAFCIAEQNPAMLLIAGTVAAMSWYITEGPTGRPLPLWLTNIAAVAVLGFLLMRLMVWRTDDLVIAMGHFTMWIQIVLLYREKTAREEGQLLVLSAVQMIAASVVSISMIYGALLAIYCLLALATVLLFQFKATSDHVQSTNQAAAPEGRVVEPPKPVVTRGYRWQLRTSGLSVGLTCAAVAVMVFVFTPRRDMAQQWAGPDGSGAREQVGFSESVRLGGGTGSSGGEHTVLNIRLSEDGERIGGAEKPLYVRGTALDRYNARTHTWMRSFIATHRDRRARFGDPVFGEPGRGGADPSIRLADVPADTPVREAEITLRRRGDGVLFTLYPGPLWIESEHADRLFFNALDQRMAVPGGGGTMVYRIAMPTDPVANFEELYRERVDVRGRGFGRASYRPPDPADLARYARNWPVQTQRVRRFAEQILEPHGLARDPTERHTADDGRIAAILAQYLATEFDYALTNPSVPRGEDAVINFLFEQQQGHCELFAAAHAALCRSLGIPARVVTGYLATDYNRIGGYYTVRQRNAHAWTEAHLGPGLGWQRFDATPAEPLEQQHRPATGWIAQMRQFYNYLEFTWLGSIVTYDRASRRQVIDEMQRSVAQAARSDDHWLGVVVGFFRDLPQAWRLERINYTLAGLILIALAVALATLVHTLILRRRRMAALQLTALPRGKRRELARRLSFYIQMLDTLERHGYVRPRWQSPQAFATELAEANPMRFDPVVALTELFYEVRFGYRPLDEDRKQRVRAHLRHLEYALNEARR